MKTQARHRQKWDKYLLTYSAKQEMEEGQFQIALPRGWRERLPTSLYKLISKKHVKSLATPLVS